MKKKYEFDGEFKFLENSQNLKQYLIISTICTIALAYMVVYHIVSKSSIPYWYLLLGFGVISYAGVGIYLYRILRYLYKLLVISMSNDNFDRVKLHLFRLTKGGDSAFNGMMLAAVNAFALQLLAALIWNQDIPTWILIVINVMITLYNLCSILYYSKIAFDIDRYSKSITEVVNHRRNKLNKTL